MLAELDPVDVQQPPAMLAFLGRHLAKDVGAAHVVAAQALGDVQVDAAVLFLAGDRQGKDFAFSQIGEISHGGECGCPGYAVKWES